MKTKRNRKRAYKWDGVLIVVLLAAALFAFLFLRTRAPGEVVRVYRENTCVAQYPLHTDGTYVLAGGGNVLCVREGVAYMESARCPDRLCVRRGGICRAGESIVCLPNRIVVEIAGGS